MVLEGGTLTSSAGSRGGLPVRPGVSFGGCGVWIGVGCAGVWFVGTLLGPEGTGRARRCGGWGLLLLFRGSLVLVPACSLRGVRGWRGRVEGVWSYVENCTVDASIFFGPATVVVGFV